MAVTADASDLVVGDLVDLDIGPPAHGGSCVARYLGRVVFVRLALPGEHVRVRITDARPGGFCRGDAVDVLRADPDRVVPPCSHFGPCGGCDLQHATGERQRSWKAAVVEEQLRRLGGVTMSVVVEPLDDRTDRADLTAGFGWRTRVRWALDDDGRIGPRAARSHQVIPVTPDEPCLIAAPGLSELASGLQPPDGIRRSVARHELRGRAADRRRKGRDRRAGHHGAGFPEVVLAVDSTGRPAVTWDGEQPGVLDERAVGRDFGVAGDGFWQVHPAAAEALAAAVDDAVADRLPAGGAAWDLYGGVGLFAAVLADRVGSAGSVLTVEGDQAASSLAAANLADLPQVTAVADRVEAALARPPDALPQVHRPVDAVVLDPPRSGAGRELCTAIAGREPAVIVYVACDPAALGRDTAALAAAGYRLESLRAFDAFPQTHHVECVAVFLRS